MPLAGVAGAAPSAGLAARPARSAAARAAAERCRGVLRHHAACSHSPAKPIKIIVGFPAGGPLDAHGGLLADRVGQLLGQPVIVDCKAGAGGSVGAEFVAKSEADGHTLLLANTGTMVINPAIYTKSPYRTLRDFAPVARTATKPLAFLVNPSVKAETLKEFIALAKQQPGRLNVRCPTRRR